MKWLQNGNLAKLVAFFVIAVVITCTVSFAANGWQSITNFDPQKDNSNSNNEAAGDSDGDGDVQDETVEVVLPSPKYYHSITGLETSLEESIKRPLSFVFNSTDPLYGISSSYLTIELPIEYGNTRLLCFTDDAKTLGKIGSLAPSRGYIESLSAYYGGILLSYGSDDAIGYEYLKSSEKLDFLETVGYCYTEYNSFAYTNADLVNAFIKNSRVNQSSSEAVSLPYDFCAPDDKIDLIGETATGITITYSDGNTTQLSYSSYDKTYVYTKNSSIKNDLLNDKPLKYDNAFILYANSTTYETEDNIQFVLDTYTKGKGLYLCEGKYVPISWERDPSGTLVFYNAEGERLTVNRGTTYISFVKSSEAKSVKIS